jgi:molybdate transport system permease protein
LLARQKVWWKEIIAAVVALPIVLPPTVLGFYLLLLLAPSSPLMELLQPFGIQSLAFTFPGLLIGSMVYSLPFAVQPIRNGFEAMGDRPMEVAATLRATPLNAFFTVAVPQARRGFLTAAVLVFAHTVGEFGVVLMIGGGIPGQTEVISVKLYQLVESLQFGEAHRLAAGLLVFSFVVLLTMFLTERRARKTAP